MIHSIPLTTRSTLRTRFLTRSTRFSTRSTRFSTCSIRLSTRSTRLSTRSTRSTICQSFYHWSVLSLYSLRFLLDEMVQDKIIWFGKKKFPNLLTTSNKRWIKQKTTQKPSREAEKTCEKLMILIEKSKILEQKLYCVGNYLYSYNFKPRARESGNAWKVITSEFQQL